MKDPIYILIVISLISCGQNNTVEKEKNLDVSDAQIVTPKEEKLVTFEEKTSVNQTVPEIQEDKPNYVNRIQPDFFNINTSQFNQFKEDNSKWFISSDGKSKLYIAPYTDYSITTAILTGKEISDLELINLLQSEGIEINNHKKTIEIDKIQTEKGIKLGLSIKEVKKIFGTPNSVEQVNNKKMLAWRFIMLTNEDPDKAGGLKPFILEGLEFVVKMEFADNKLTTVVYKYEIP